MQEYKYSYQDWVNGVIRTNDLYDLYLFKEISLSDINQIAATQDKAFRAYIKNDLLHKINGFLNEYKMTIAQMRLLDHSIEHEEKITNELILKYPKVYRGAISGYDGRQELTYEEVKLINEGSPEFSYFEEMTPGIIVKLKYIEWLKWFRNKELKAQETVFEQYFAQASQQENGESQNDSLERFKPKFITWPNLFKEPDQANIVLSLIDEHLSSTGQWITGKAGRYLVALYLELKEKGYLKLTPSSLIVSQAFNSQFGTDLSYKIYEPQKSKEAEDYREYFKHIPAFKPIAKV